jgi:hypothetical protein
MRNDKKTFGVSKRSNIAKPLKNLLEIKTWGTKWKRKMDKITKWVTW